MERDRLPELVSPVEIAGTVSDEGARRFGIPQGLPVIIGAGDKQSELLGAGVTTGNIAEISYGTAAVIELLSSKYVTHPRMDFFTWGAAIPRTLGAGGFCRQGILDGFVVQTGIWETRDGRGFETGRGA